MAKNQESELTIVGIDMTSMDFHLVGTSPLVPHAVSAKAAGELIWPKGRKSAADKASTMKHEPFDEFRDAAYQFRDDDNAPTRLYMPAGAFHAAIADVAIDMVGASKAQTARLTRVPGDKIPVWGVPQIYSTIVRSSNMQRTPDVRTLPILPRWACSITVMFPTALIKYQSIANLLGNAGLIIGVGDGRPQKGKKAFGCWRVCAEGDEEWNSIVKIGGTKAQDQALADPAYYDRETDQILTWFLNEKNTRVAQPAKSPRARKEKTEIPPLPIVEEYVGNGAAVK
jgi:hypothetical protein